MRNIGKSRLSHRNTICSNSRLYGSFECRSHFEVLEAHAREKMITFRAVVLASIIVLLVLGAATSVNTLLSEFPSVKLHITFKRESLKLHGHSEFDIYASPVVSVNASSLIYDSYATLKDSRSEYKYTLKDGFAYLTTTDALGSKMTHCLTLSTMPFDQILPALNGAIPIPSAYINNKSIECASGKLFETQFAGTSYAICASGKATAYSNDLDITVEYLQNPINVSRPDMLADPAPCGTVQKAMSLTSTALAFASGNKILSNAYRKLKEEASMFLRSKSCNKCSTTPRPCIFFHGSGNELEMPELQDNADLLKDKFGDIYGHAPCCSSIKYAVLDTMNAGWRNASLQQKFCKHSLSMSPTSDVAAKIIDNTIVVTHSMGGLVMADALVNNRCSFSDTTSWVALSPPMMGSMASDYLMDICSIKGSRLRIGLLKMFDQCPAAESRKSTCYQGEKYSNPSLDAAYLAAQKAYRENVDAVMCSDNYNGVHSKFEAPSILAGKLIKHKSKENDGLVEFESCAGGLDAGLFDDHYSSAFYRPRLNHADTAFLTDDSPFFDSQKPHKWFKCLKYNIS
ncbi:uncharacterized protein PHALS_11179 [Plasmopara halstedii]|uniref:Uncharacterized protein n=1 Tax=Plasmopara halstedii TaxID=4781 RepID=A0A0P1AJN9_PLAHL|nr:uncharacterized protein PHALS_11179 [Plasmopara halstedii]CEG41009.1 hypothetical protein PHALS_11179 [Plasmopara halstedii]|eukprot:XP_024577378.1 hypothetical protein PHALS_11179 [Plasmopara halstedii]